MSGRLSEGKLLAVCGLVFAGLWVFANWNEPQFTVEGYYNTFARLAERLSPVAEMLDLPGGLTAAAILTAAGMLNMRIFGNGWVGVKNNITLATCGFVFFFVSGMLGQLIWTMLSGVFS